MIQNILGYLYSFLKKVFNFNLFSFFFPSFTGIKADGD